MTDRRALTLAALRSHGAFDWFTAEDLLATTYWEAAPNSAAYIAAANPAVVLALLDGKATWKRRAMLLRHYLDVVRKEVYQKQVRIEALLDVVEAAADVDGMWEAEDGELIRWLPETSETLNDLRAALARYEEATLER